MNYIRTDLAIEASGANKTENNVDGVNIVNRVEDFNIDITEVEVLNEKGEQAIGKPKGKYITIDCQGMKDQRASEGKKLIEIISKELCSLVDEYKEKGVLVVGLGNRHITPDSLGPYVCDKVFVNRHVANAMPELMGDAMCEVSAISPGVLGITGIETVEIVKGVVEHIKPGVLIAIDSLASRSINRINNTFQITNTGISPGSGIGNKRKSLTEQELGVPVIAIGVPLVVYASTIAFDLISQAIDESGKEEQELEDVVKKCVGNIMDVKQGDMVVTPKEIDVLVKDCAKTISGAINMCACPNMTLEDINMLIN